KGNLFATGLVAGGALLGVVFAFLNIPAAIAAGLQKLSAEEWLLRNIGTLGYYLLGIAFFSLMAYTLYRLGTKRERLSTAFPRGIK
ncbi:MAG: hypothetical protein ICV66_04090, partial [Chitinophagaceae bacterium]|nr:hypothetical protein [Chitinophagaceae bacterium]